tara:strand:- start:4397 stop:4513 length:117 start_codon:yes stop_codon:yes gene_type:complete
MVSILADLPLSPHIEKKNGFSTLWYHNQIPSSDQDRSA